ncbi:MAG: ASCH domain-containing protein [Bacteroidota bacterium]
MPTLHTISLWQPWASLITRGHKSIETRSWSVPPTLIGKRVAIHASSKAPPVAELDHMTQKAIHNALDVLPHQWKDVLPRGAIIGTVRIAGCYTSLDWKMGTKGIDLDASRTVPGSIPLDGILLSEHEIYFGNYLPGRKLWLLEDAEEFLEPVPARGALGFWLWRTLCVPQSRT